MKLTILIASPIFGLINKKFHNTIFNSKRYPSFGSGFSGYL